jgi:hypothetical protein
MVEHSSSRGGGARQQRSGPRPAPASRALNRPGRNLHPARYLAAGSFLRVRCMQWCFMQWRCWAAAAAPDGAAGGLHRAHPIHERSNLVPATSLAPSAHAQLGCTGFQTEVEQALAAMLYFTVGRF